MAAFPLPHNPTAPSSLIVYDPKMLASAVAAFQAALVIDCLADFGSNLTMCTVSLFLALNIFTP
jgi:hypothetical protein